MLRKFLTFAKERLHQSLAVCNQNCTLTALCDVSVSEQNILPTKMHIGDRIKEVLFMKERTACWLANQIPCERSNVYHIFKRSDISIELLMKISLILGHDFFADLSRSYRTEKGK